MNIRSFLMLTVLTVSAGWAANVQGDPPAIPATLQQADRLFEDQQ